MGAYSRDIFEYKPPPHFKLDVVQKYRPAGSFMMLDVSLVMNIMRTLHIESTDSVVILNGLHTCTLVIRDLLRLTPLPLHA